MNYPFWDVEIGYGLLMAAISIVHVFISHFAIGGGLYLVLAEMSARKRGDELKLEFLKKLSKFFVLVSVVFGALTGVGIWFIIGLLNPAATEALIHNFVWGWATEWTFFVVEIAAALIYFYGWEKMSARSHIIVGWIYFVSAWMSLAVINGILAFMLTPGEWLNTGSFWDGFLNPTYLPSTVLRTGICIMLAGVYALLVASRYKPDAFKARLVRYNTVWALAGMAVMLPSLFWFTSTIPEEITGKFLNTHLLPVSAMNASFINYGLLGITLILFGLILPKKYNLLPGVLAMLFALSWFGEFEFMRESIRKPYVIYQYMYGNGLEVAKQEQYAEEGLLANMVFRTGNDGADLFRRACRSCHTIDGYKALSPAYDGTDAAFIAGTIRGAHVMLNGVMPPFMGTPEEADLIAEHIHERIDQRPFSEIYPLSGVDLGRKAFDIRCGKCHAFGSEMDLSETLIGMDEEEYLELLDMAGDMADEMPPYTGDETEKAALVEYMMSLEEGGAQ